MEISEERLMQLLQKAAADAVEQTLGRPNLRKELTQQGKLVQIRKSPLAVYCFKLLGVNLELTNLSDLARKLIVSALDLIEKEPDLLVKLSGSVNFRFNFHADRPLRMRIEKAPIAASELLILGLLLELTKKTKD